MSEVKATPATGTPVLGSVDIPAAVPIPVAGPPKKAPPPNLVVPPKKPKLSKAERRALQEQQRAAKSGDRGNGAPVQSPSTAPQQTNNKVPAVHVEQKQHQQYVTQHSDTSGNTTAEKEVHTKAEDTNANHKKSKGIALLSHLPPYRGTLGKLHSAHCVHVTTLLITILSLTCFIVSSFQTHTCRSLRSQRFILRRPSRRQTISILSHTPPRRLGNWPGVRHGVHLGQQQPLPRHAQRPPPGHIRLFAPTGRGYSQSRDQPGPETQFHLLDAGMSAAFGQHGQCRHLCQIGSRGRVGSGHVLEGVSDGVAGIDRGVHTRTNRLCRLGHCGGRV